MRVDLHEARTGQHKDRGSLRQRIARAARVSTRSVRAHCMLVGGRVVHKRGCTPRHPRCAWSRRAYGEIVCDCPAYDFLHRQGSGRCGDQRFGRGRWAQNDPDRAYTTITSRGRKDRFSTLKRAVEHARILAAHDRVHVDVLLGSRVVSRVRPGAARDLVSAEKRAENRTIDIFTGRTKIEEGKKGRKDWKGEAEKAARELAICRKTGRDPKKIPTFGWKGYKLADLSFADLDLLRLQIIANPKNHTPRDAKGHPVRGVWLYTPTARKKLEALAWAVTYKLQGQGGATRHSQQRSRKRRSARDDAPDTKRLDEAPVTKRSSSWPPETSSSRPPRGGLLSGRATYAREVLGLLRSGHGLSGTQSIRLIAKWNVLVDRAWRAGKTPCSTADHMVKYENAQICPCTSAGRDCARCKTRKKGRR